MSSAAAWTPASTRTTSCFILFIKYITDKYGDSTDFAPPVTIPKGASFTDMLAQANDRLARSDFPDFNDSNKLGEGQAKVERLTNLVRFWCRQPTGIGDNEIWRIVKRNGILYLPDVGSKTTSFFSAFAGIFASN